MTAPPAWTVVPFGLYLVAIAVLPLVLPHFWEKNRNKLVIAVLVSLPVAGWLLWSGKGGPHSLGESLKEYAAFIALLASLFIISGGIYLRGSLAGTPIVNTGMLAIGSVLASFIGTTGASMLLIRPLLRANGKRVRKIHLVVFFIFIVSNAGGMLTPLGDPPLFLGFLRGVPFLWTLKLFLPWAFVNAILLIAFNFIDQGVFNKEEMARKGSQLEEVQQVREPLRVEGGLNFLWLLGVIAINSGVGYFGKSRGWSEDLQKILLVAGMAAMAGVSLAATSRQTRRDNRFTWGPIVEVAVLFIGIFVTMVPALELLKAKGADLGVKAPWQFFWASGALSSFLDNAPTYLVFVSLGQGAGVIPADLSQAGNNLFLKAVACGAVFMGANTYIGNGPNFMVKAIAEESGVRMPSFVGYMAWSTAILIPIFVAVTLLFFRA